MRSLKLALLATAATAVFSSAAFAADLIVDTPDIPVVDNSFTFDGAYIGVYGEAMMPAAFGVGIDVGANAVMDSLVVGGELSGAVLTGVNFDGQLTAKVGGLIADTAIVYVYSGIGAKTPTSFYVPVGVGAEFAVADNLGLKVEGQYNFDLTTAAQNSTAIKVGLNWHF
jgi:opacity protein-like surface antigen